MSFNSSENGHASPGVLLRAWYKLYLVLFDVFAWAFHQVLTTFTLLIRAIRTVLSAGSYVKTLLVILYLAVRGEDPEDDEPADFELGPERNSHEVTSGDAATDPSPEEENEGDRRVIRIDLQDDHEIAYYDGELSPGKVMAENVLIRGGDDGLQEMRNRLASVSPETKSMSRREFQGFMAPDDFESSLDGSRDELKDVFEDIPESVQVDWLDWDRLNEYDDIRWWYDEQPPKITVMLALETLTKARARVLVAREGILGTLFPNVHVKERWVSKDDVGSPNVTLSEDELVIDFRD